MDEDLVGVCSVIDGYIFSAFFCFFIGVAAVEANEMEIMQTTSKDFFGGFLGEAYLLGNLLDRLGIAFVLI